MAVMVTFFEKAQPDIVPPMQAVRVRPPQLRARRVVP